MCPKCKNQLTIQGNPGEKTIITCSNCGLKGQFTFKDEGIAGKTSGEYSIEIIDLKKHYKDVKAVDGISFGVKTGEIFGFLGPNGAGKTTTIKAMLGLLNMDSGEIKINGFDIVKNSIEARRDVGFLPERVSFYDNLTPVQTLNFFCELRGNDKSIVKSLLQNVGLEDAMNRKVGTFSKGMVQLLGVAQSLIGDPPVYIFDEPMSGLDPRWVKVIRDKIKMLNKRGATIMFSSHILSEVEALCDRVAIIDKGKIIAVDTVTNLNKYLKIKPRLEITVPGLKGKVPDVVRNLKGVEAVKAKDDVLTVTCESSVRSKVITVIEEAGFKIDNIKTVEPSLEDAFVKLVSGGA
jgi:ABC-2 type transport system ATP-binding protein